MGVDKAAQAWLGRRAVDRVADLAVVSGAATVVTVGAEHYGLPSVADEPPLGGPVGGVLAGAKVLADAGCGRALVLAVDAPSLTAADLAPLLTAPAPGAAYEGLHFPLVVALEALPAEAEAGWPMARLLERAGVTRPLPPPEARLRLRGANTPDELTALLAELSARENAQNPGAG